MLNAIRTVAVIGLITIAGIAQAEPTSGASLNGNADLCFNEAQRAIGGADPATLSAASCRRALQHDPISRADRSAMLHNRGLIEQAKGDLERALVSFSNAVRLSTTVDIRNLALAQAAHRQGEFALAVEQYDLLLKADYLAQDADALAKTETNRRLAADALVASDLY